MADTAWHFLAGFQNKGKGARRSGLQQPVLAVVYTGVVGQFAQVPAEQGEVVLIVHTADAAQGICRRLVIEVADQRVAGVGRYRNNLALFKQSHGLLEQARLGIVGVNFEILRHDLLNARGE